MGGDPKVIVPAIARFVPSASRLSIDDLHHSWRIALARRRSLGQRVFDAIEIFFTQHDIGSADVLFETSKAAGTRDGDYVLVAEEEPCQGKLSGGTLLFFRHLSQAIGDGKISGELFSLKTRITTPPVAVCQVIHSAKPAAEKSATQRTVSHQCDTELMQDRQQTVFGLTTE